MTIFLRPLFFLLIRSLIQTQQEAKRMVSRILVPDLPPPNPEAARRRIAILSRVSEAKERAGMA